LLFSSLKSSARLAEATTIAMDDARRLHEGMFLLLKAVGVGK
jgi:hypothetical protein